MGWILLGLTAGIGMPMQTASNTRLKNKYNGNAFCAAGFSYLTSVVILSIFLAVTGTGFSMPWGRMAAEPAWIWVGGLCGIYYQTCMTLIMPRLGSIQTAIFPIVGQVMMSMTIDHFGFFKANVNRITSARLIGAILVLSGAVIISLTKSSSGSDSGRAEGVSAWLWRLLGFSIGSVSACQTAINGQLGKLVESPLKASCYSFATGLICLVAIIFLMSLRTGKVKSEPGLRPYWMWLGGVYGTLYNLSSIYLAVRMGTGLAVLTLLTGIMIGGVVVDQFGLFEVKRSPVNALKAGCIIMMLAGIAMIRLL